MASKSNTKSANGSSNLSFHGWRRENGRVGVRNHVVILPLDDLSNAACEAVANNIKGTLAIPHAYGRLQFGADLDLHFRTLLGTGCNPNVAAVVVIGIEDGWTKRVVDGIADVEEQRKAIRDLPRVFMPNLMTLRAIFRSCAHRARMRLATRSACSP